MTIQAELNLKQNCMSTANQPSSFLLQVQICLIFLAYILIGCEEERADQKEPEAYNILFIAIDDL